jgi:D-proline reductase (dithiol) PrdB
MAHLSDLPLKYRMFYKVYRFSRSDWSAGAELSVPLANARLAVVTTAAFSLPGQPLFDETVPGGDVSYREIPNDVDLSSLLISHRSDAFDWKGIESDANLALPLDRLREMANGGEIGSVAPRHFSFQGSITKPKRLIEETAPRVAAELVEDQVDAVLLTPV